MTVGSCTVTAERNFKYCWKTDKGNVRRGRGYTKEMCGTKKNYFISKRFSRLFIGLNKSLGTLYLHPPMRLNCLSSQIDVITCFLFYYCRYSKSNASFSCFCICYGDRMRHCGSGGGGDWTLLLLVLPTVLGTKF